jgi:hypothetical protein
MYYSKQNTAQLLLNYYRFDHVYRSSSIYQTHKFSFDCLIWKPNPVAEPNVRNFRFYVRESIKKSCNDETFPAQNELLTRPNCKKTILSEIWEKLPDEVSQWYAQYDSDGTYFPIIPPHEYIVQNKMNDIDGLVTDDNYLDRFEDTITAWEEGILSLSNNLIKEHEWVCTDLKVTEKEHGANSYGRRFVMYVRLPSVCMVD